MAPQKILRIILKCILLVLTNLLLSGCVTYFGYDGPYEGRVVDLETGKPLEGAVVHGTWVKSSPGPGGASSKYYDSREVLTDNEGRFRIEGMGRLIFSNIEEMEINVFKAGYTQVHGYWTGLRVDSAAAQFVEWRDGKPTIKLKQMSIEERLKRHAYTPSTPENKQIKLFMREENKENIEIGRPKNTLYPEELLR